MNMIAIAILLKDIKLVAIALAVITTVQIQSRNTEIPSVNTRKDKANLVVHNNQTESNIVYAVIVDAGSTGSRALAFKFAQTRDSSLQIMESKKFSTKPGLSAFADDLDKAAKSISDLLDDAKTFVPQKYQKKTKLQLRATAGLRHLGSEKSENILKILFKECIFDTNDDSAGIMDGDDEGVFLWFTVNFLQKHLNGEMDQTTAVIDLGGGSVQISYHPLTNDSQDVFHHYIIMGRSIMLYSKSYSDMGLMSVRELTYTYTETKDGKNYFTSPCLHENAKEVQYTFGPKEYFVSGENNDSGNCFENCRKKIEDTVDFSLFKKLTDDNREIAVISYFYDLALTETLIVGSQGNTNVQSYYNAATKECSKKNIEKDNAFLCLDLLYVALLLDIGFGLPSIRNIKVLHKIDTHEISWALGAAYHLLQPEATKILDQTVARDIVIEEN